MKRVNAELLTKTKDVVHLGDYSIDFLLENISNKCCSGLATYVFCGEKIKNK